VNTSMLVGEGLGAGVVDAGLTTGLVMVPVFVGVGTTETELAGKFGVVVAAAPFGEFIKSPTEVQKPTKSSRTG